MKWCVGAVLTVLSSFGIFCHAQGNICEGYTCHVKKGVCKRDEKSMPLFQKIPATPIMNKIGSANVIVCPGGEEQCPPGRSCCSVPGSDLFHCCPGGYSCEQGLCVFSTSETKVVTGLPTGYTCCQVDSSYNFCPMPQAVCCSDHMHCCPRGFKCSPDGKTCSSGFHTLFSLFATPSKTLKKDFNRFLGLITGRSVKGMKLPSHNAKRQHDIEKRLDTVICPDGESQCSDGNTCCKLPSGQWGCCPLPKAVCCGDGVHCCPNGYTCDVSAGTCSKGSKGIPMLQKIPSLKSGAEESNVVCPNGQSECPDGNTCRKLSKGQWGCCPLPQAVCCSDGVHCCPNGYTCDVSSGTCSSGSESTTMLQKISTLKEKVKVSSVVCPDGESECPDGNTCCKLSSGQWGCCPLPHAVCCSDGEHSLSSEYCCPIGYTCDVSAGACILRQLQKLPYAGGGCCEHYAGQWHCCPLQNSVCCSGGHYCCPNGYTCNAVSKGTCGSPSKLMVQKISASKKRVRNVICPHGQAECPGGNTCCKLSSGELGC